jgi:hypothetical protein
MASILALSFAALIILQNIATGSIEGTVVGVGMDPLERAVVELRSLKPPVDQGTADGLTLLTDADGKFQFQNLPAGQYRLTATRGAGFFSAEYGQREVGGPGVVLTLSDGQRLSGIKIEMTPTAAISGRVFDGAVPAAYARVEAVKVAYSEGGRTLAVAQSVDANDKGEYRLFWLEPGRYFVRAIAKTEAGLARVLSRVDDTQPLPGIVADETRVPVYFPGTPDSEAAVPVELRVGEDKRGVDIGTAQSRARAYRIRGSVMNADTGGIAVWSRVQAIPKAGGYAIPSITADDDARFELFGVVPGSYIVTATAYGRDGIVGRASVDVSESDVEDVTIEVRQGFTLRGRVLSESRSEFGADTTGLTVELRSRDGVSGSVPAQPVSPDGHFALSPVTPGDYAVLVRKLAASSHGAGSGLYARSVRLGPEDVLNNGLHVEGPFDDTLEIVLASDGGTLEGRTVDTQGASRASTTVALIPEEAQRGRTDLFHTTTSDANGRFFLTGIPPGNYRLYAWEHVEPGAWFDPQFLKSQRTDGVFVHVTPGGRLTVELPVVRESNR